MAEAMTPRRCGDVPHLPVWREFNWRIVAVFSLITNLDFVVCKTGNSGVPL
jgi:hypothetical protein